jgi:hypothetical protein
VDSIQRQQFIDLLADLRKVQTTLNDMRHKVDAEIEGAAECLDDVLGAAIEKLVAAEAFLEFVIGAEEPERRNKILLLLRKT